MKQVMNCEKTNVLLLHVQGVKGGAVGRGVEIKGKGAEFIDKLNAEWNTIAAGNRMFCI